MTNQGLTLWLQSWDSRSLTAFSRGSFSTLKDTKTPGYIRCGINCALVAKIRRFSALSVQGQ